MSGLIVGVGALLLLLAPPASAYQRYKNAGGSGNCSTCHGDFDGPMSPIGTTFPSDSKHEMHWANGPMATNCNLCHTSGDGRNPFIGSSDGTNDTPGLGCVGCHGRAEDAGQDSVSNGLGAGLRQHHHRAGVFTCAGCHDDANPAMATLVGEDVPPPYYGSPDTLVAMPCNPTAMTNVNENWSVGDFLGLDNDGDLVYDAADPDCQAGTTTTTSSSSTSTTTSTAPTTTSSSTSTTSSTATSSTATSSTATSSTATSSTATSSTATSSTATSTTMATSTTTVSSTTVTSTVPTTSTTTTTLPGTVVFPAGTKLVVKQTKSGQQRLKLIAKDASVVATSPCEVAGELVIHAMGAGAPQLRLDLDASLWKPLKAKKPEKGCKYKKGPVVATVIVKAGKLIKVSAAGSDLGVPLATDPSPVAVEMRHGDVRHCLSFGSEVKHVADKKLVAKGAAPASACPSGT